MARKAPHPAPRRSVIGMIGVTAVAAALLPAPPAQAGTGTFANPAPITIPRAESLYSVSTAFPPSVIPADQYPAPIEVAGLAGSITDVEVTLHGLRHTYPADVHVLLVGPIGHSAMLMGHCGGLMPISEKTITFDDEAAAELPYQEPVTSGTVKPADPRTGTSRACFGSEVGAPAPAPQAGPAGPYANALSVFDGNHPNGTWRLFVFDDFADFDEGEIAGGWSLRVETTR